MGDGAAKRGRVGRRRLAGAVAAVAISGDALAANTGLATTSTEHARRIPPAAPKTGQAALTLEHRWHLPGAATELVWNADGSRLAVALGSSTEVAVHDSGGWQEVCRFRRSSGPDSPSLGFLPDNRIVTRAPPGARPGDCCFSIHDGNTGALLRQVAPPAGLRIHDGYPPQALAVGPDGSAVAVVVQQVTDRPDRQGQRIVTTLLLAYDLRQGRFIDHHVELGGEGRFILCAGAGNKIAVAQGDHLRAAGRKAIRVFDLPSLHEMPRLDGHIPAVRAMAWSPDGTRLISGPDGTASAPPPTTWARDPNPIRLWDAGAGILVNAIEGSCEPVRGLSWHPAGRHFVSISARIAPPVWPRASRPGSLLRIIAADGLRTVFSAETDIRSGIQAAAFAPVGSRLGICRDDGRIEIYSVRLP